MAHRYFRRVYGICVWTPAVHLAPGEVIIRSTPRSGDASYRPRAPTADDHDQALQQVAADLVAANFDIPLPEDVMPWKYRKLISNIGNVFQALVGRNGDWRLLVTDAEAEARRVLDAAAIRYIGEAEETAARAAGFTMKPVPGPTQFVGGSTWQSLQRGTGNIETDYLSGEIVMIAHRLGIDAPINEQLATLARRAAATGAKPGDMSAEQLADLLQRVTALSGCGIPTRGITGAVPGVHAQREATGSLRASGIAHRRTGRSERRRSSSASDDDGGGSTARCASSWQYRLEDYRWTARSFCEVLMASDPFGR